MGGDDEVKRIQYEIERLESDLETSKEQLEKDEDYLRKMREDNNPSPRLEEAIEEFRDRVSNERRDIADTERAIRQLNIKKDSLLMLRSQSGPDRSGPER